MSGSGTSPLIYCGLDLAAWEILSGSERFEIAAVNKIPDFLTHRTVNPFDYIFKAIYLLRSKQTLPRAERILSLIYRRTSFLSSALYKRYARYLERLCDKKTPILDLEDIRGFETFVRQSNVELMVVNNWWILPDRIINAPVRGTVNIHPSRLPQYRGSLPTLWALRNKDQETAVSFILLARKMDGGNVIAQYPIALDAQEDAISLEKKIEAVLTERLEATLEAYLANKTSPVVQDDVAASVTARYFDYMKINWNQESAQDIADKINLYPYLWPVHYCWTGVHNRKIDIRNASVCSGPDILQGVSGSFCVKKLDLYVRSFNGVVRIRLFEDIAWIPSVLLLMGRCGEFGEVQE